MINTTAKPFRFSIADKGQPDAKHIMLLVKVIITIITIFVLVMVCIYGF